MEQNLFRVLTANFKKKKGAGYIGDYLHKVFGGELKIISQSIDGDGLVGWAASRRFRFV
jgi:hypothetical protein